MFVARSLHSLLQVLATDCASENEVSDDLGVRFGRDSGGIFARGSDGLGNSGPKRGTDLASLHEI